MKEVPDAAADVMAQGRERERQLPLDDLLEMARLSIRNQFENRVAGRAPLPRLEEWGILDSQIISEI